MAKIKPFACVRPARELAATVAALPYDVYGRAEARAEVQKHPQSFLAIDRPETQFDEQADMYAPEVYAKAAQMLREWIDQGVFIRDTERAYYLYELTMDGRTQTGVVACASIDDYETGVIKKHENTRADKEQDRICHVDACSAQTGPIFLAYRRNETIAALTEKVKTRAPLYDFVAEDGIRHRVFRISEAEEMEQIGDAFSAMQQIYIADGHHRAASAVKVGKLRREKHPDYDGTEEFNYFLSVLFPDDELKILAYNRVVKDLNGNSPEQFLREVKTRFELAPLQGTIGDGTLAADDVQPKEAGTFSMYVGGSWYRCVMREIPDDPVEGLDVSVLQNQLLAPVLGIKDPKTDERISFVGGIRGLAELEQRAGDGVAFAMYPTSIAQLFAVADAGRLMPPKSTWFEPKLRSGLFIHEI